MSYLTGRCFGCRQLSDKLQPILPQPIPEVTLCLCEDCRHHLLQRYDESTEYDTVPAFFFKED